MHRPRTPDRIAARLALAIPLTLALAPAASADTLLRMKSHTDAFQMMGQSQPAQDEEITLWIGEDRASRSDGETTMLVRLDQEKLYVIDHQGETYSVLDLPVDFTEYLPPEMKQQMGQMLEAMQMTATVEPTEERKEIGGWDTRLYRVSLSNQMGMSIRSQVWATDEVDVDRSSFESLTRALASLQPGAGAAAEELLEIEGVPVLVESEIQGMGGGTRSREELVSAETKAPPAGTYEVPEGFTEQAWNPMARGGR